MTFDTVANRAVVESPSIQMNLILRIALAGYWAAIASLEAGAQMKLGKAALRAAITALAVGFVAACLGCSGRKAFGEGAIASSIQLI